MPRYCIFDPTGNITALVESETPASDQPALAAALMRRHPELEQVGFVRGNTLRMAGGEFCGNASMCAAALLLLREGLDSGERRLLVSGTSAPVAVRLRREGPDRFRTEICMPPALEITEAEFSFEGLRAPLPLVRLEGITHLVAERDAPFFALLGDRPAAERAVHSFCDTLGAGGVGLLFLDRGEGERRMTPLVYVPGSGTTFWENSCASGSAAVGMLLAKRGGAPAELVLRQPGGVLRARSDMRGGTWLSGAVRLVGEYDL